MRENNVFQTGENIETIMEIDSVDDYDCITSDTITQNYVSQYSLDGESLMVVEEVEEYDAGSSSDFDYVKHNLSNKNISIGILEHENTVSGIIELSDQQVTIKKSIMSKNEYLSLRDDDNDSLNLENIAISKTDTPCIILNSPIISSQIEKTMSMSMAPTTSAVKPTTATAWFHSNSNITKINTLFSSPKQDLIVTSSNESNSGIFMIPHDCINYSTEEKIKYDNSTVQLINSSANEHQFGECVGIQKSSDNSCQFENSQESRHLQFKRPGSPAKSSPKKMAKSVDFIITS